MLTKWTLSNFKSVRQETRLTLAPLTIFAGANSSGKSTIIQSILLTAQTIQSPVHGRSVVLNGHIVRLGSHSDIVSDPATKDPISIGFEIRPPKSGDSVGQEARMYAEPFGYPPSEFMRRTNAIECAFSFSNNGSSTEQEVLDLQPRLSSSRVKIHLNTDQGAQDSEISIARSQNRPDQRAAKFNIDVNTLSDAERASLEYEVLQPERLRSGRRYYRGFGLPFKASCAGGILSHFFPLHLSIVYDAIEEEARKQLDMARPWSESRFIEQDFDSKLNASVRNKLLEIFKSLISESDPSQLGSLRAAAAIEKLSRDFSQEQFAKAMVRLPATLRSHLFAKIMEHETELLALVKAGRPPQYVLKFAPLPPATEFAIDYVKQYFRSQLKYLGPLRDEPKPVYPLSGATDPKDVGYKGEHTAAVLDLYKHTIVDYIAPSICQGVPDPAPKKRGSLLDAVSDWLNYLGVVQNVRTVDRGKLGHELKVSTTDAPAMHDLTHVGVGVSQVLPILVLALLAENDSTLIFEQPELHLHPRVQTRLADFFVSMTTLGRQCIVETHSEYMINRLRFLAAASSSKQICSDTILYFVEKANGQSKYSEIRINEFGAIPSWPKGFFDEGEEMAAAILKASIEKRRKAYKND